MQQPTSASRTTQATLIACAVLVGVAIKIGGGNYHPIAIALLLVAILTVLHGVAGKPFSILERLSARWVAMGTVAAALVSLAILLVPPIVPPSTSASSEVPMYRVLELCGVEPPVQSPQSPLLAAILMILCGAAGVAAVLSPGKISRWTMPLALLLHLAALAAAISAAPAPVMDVLVFQSAAPAQLMSGGSPYAMTFPDLSGGTSPFYGPGLQADGQLLFGFPYPPLSLLWVLPAWLAGALIQYMHAIAFTGGAAFIAYTSRSPISRAAALLFMLMPVGPMVICNGWTEPLVALMLAATVFLASRKPHWTGGGLGLFWAAKQYVPLTAPLALILCGKEPADRKRLFVAALVTAAIVTLPLVMLDVGAFWHSAVAVQLRQPFRPDALSFLAAVYHATGHAPPAWIAFVLLAAVQALCLWRCPRTSWAFATATAASLLTFFAFNKQAFANYYFLVVAACACGLAGSEAVGTGPAVKVSRKPPQRRDR